ncbi:beta-glucosidase [Consotaella aegiceratis]|uniref:beta-glucosidase n=1 Tax=Consotaella aegiceratis TaxID=3097961 RepID=UPI002F42897F
MTELFNGRSIVETVDAMTLDEKAELLSGRGMWRSQEIARLGVPSIVMTDGTYGVRYSIDQIDEDNGELDMAAFLDIVNRTARGMEEAFGRTKPATCFPNGSTLGCSFDVDLAYEIGAALAAECQEYGVNLLLGPGINIRRTPLAGRSYEYYSEDPVVSGDFAAGLIRGLQDNGVGASLKHFACNNSEIERTTMDSVVEERALREIYLLGFERAIERSDPWAVMSSYNVLNGVQASHNEWLLTDVLRREWGYGGLVVSDWHGIKDRPASLRAGNDLDMPESGARKAVLRAAMESSSLSSGTVDAACRRVLDLVARAKAGERGGKTDLDAHHELARRAALESIVLLKNEQALPLGKGRLLVVGEGAKSPIVQGSGSATTNPHLIDNPFEEIVRCAGDDGRVDFCAGWPAFEGDGGALKDEALSRACDADAVVVFANSVVGEDGEGADRKDLNLAAGQDELIAALSKVCRRIVVVLATPDAVLMPWLGDVAAVVQTFFGGQGVGWAVARILFGKANPCGKLSATFPKRLEDVPGYLTYPGENGRHLYAEGIYVGYRGYDKRDIEPLFPFGFGLSYTTFTYSGLRLDRSAVRGSEAVTVSFQVTNAGSVAGKEICQLYLRPINPRLARPPRELKGFAKVALEPGETKTVRITVAPRDFRYYDPAHCDWVLDDSWIAVEIGASSRDIRLSAEIEVEASMVRRRKLTLETQPRFILENPDAKAAFCRYFEKKFDVSATDAEKMLEYTSTSFFGIYTTINYFFKKNISEGEIQAVIDSIA